MSSLEANRFTPFFVADRQASLRLLAGLCLPASKRLGLMTHANTPVSFQDSVRAFPCVSPRACPVVGGKPCPFGQNLTKCEEGRKLRDSTIKICDSGVFTKRGRANPDYRTLFATYERMGVDFGIIIDFLKDCPATLRSAEKAMTEYRATERSFGLIGVAQGRTLSEYVRCYRALKRMGYKRIAIGGMLTKKLRSARYVYVTDERLLGDVLLSVRKTDRSGWVFALGCYAPGRHRIFLQHRISGSDYKGWIFQYSGRSVKKGDLRSQRSRFRQVRAFLEQRVLNEPQRHRQTKRLLLLSCGKAKATGKRPMPALHRYDGPLFRMVRSHLLDSATDEGPDILILSAKHGLIDSKTLIKPYDSRLSRDRARALSSDASQRLIEAFRQRNYEEVFVNMGSDYQQVVAPALSYARRHTHLRMARGRIGERLQMTKRWLTTR